MTEYALKDPYNHALVRPACSEAVPRIKTSLSFISNRRVLTQHVEFKTDSVAHVSLEDAVHMALLARTVSRHAPFELSGS